MTQNMTQTKYQKLLQKRSKFDLQQTPGNPQSGQNWADQQLQKFDK